MIRRHNLKLAYRNIRSARGRNFLTMLGVIIGVMAVVLVVCIATGIKHQIAGQLGRYAKGTFIIQPAASASSSLGGFGGFSSLLSAKDLQTVQSVPGVATAVPLSTATGKMTGDHTVNAPLILATSADLAGIINQHIAYGGFFDSDADSKSLVLGSAVAHKLFTDNDPLGQTVTWRGQPFIVAGVFDSFTAPPFSLEANFNDAVFVPYSTAQSLSSGTLELYQIYARTSNSSQLATVVRKTQDALVSAHGGAQDVVVRQAASLNSASDQTIHLLTKATVAAALVALIVGGVGIMNVMLVSVTERMHEIGIRKAIGASNRQIMRQFMAEALLLSLFGALVGAVLSAIVVGLLRLFSSLQPVLVWQVFVIAPIIAVAIGLFFGSLPALKAARKDPIDALRHE